LTMESPTKKMPAMKTKSRKDANSTMPIIPADLRRVPPRVSNPHRGSDRPTRGTPPPGWRVPETILSV
jgi:hypothetical protein